MYVIITGPKGAGKSTHLLMLAEELKKHHKTVAGVISRGFWKDGEREGYEIVNPATDASQILCTKTEPLNLEVDHIMPSCSYYFHYSAFATGNQWIAQGLTRDILFIDEVGNFELAGKGWDLKSALSCKSLVILGTREDAVPKLESVWRIKCPVITIIPGTDMMEDIINLINTI